jgi:drug/metabolite transporter (DMT)-like permease
VENQLHVRHYVVYGTLCLIWGSTWGAIRLLVQDVPPLRGATARFATAAVLLLAYALVRRLQFPRGRREWMALFWLSISMMALPYGLLFWAEQYVTSGMTAMLYASTPLMVALLTPLMLRKTVPRGAVTAMVVACGAIAVMFANGLSGSHRALLGGAAVLVAAVGSSWSTVYARRETKGIDPAISTAFQLLFGAVLLGIASVAFEHGEPANWSARAIGCVLFLAIFGSALAFALYYWLLAHMQPYQVMTINLIVPLIAISEGALLLKEPVPISMVVGTIVVLIAVASVMKTESA